MASDFLVSCRGSYHVPSVGLPRRSWTYEQQSLHQDIAIPSIGACGTCYCNLGGPDTGYGVSLPLRVQVPEHEVYIPRHSYDS